MPTRSSRCWPTSPRRLRLGDVATGRAGRRSGTFDRDGGPTARRRRSRSPRRGAGSLARFDWEAARGATLVPRRRGAGARARGRPARPAGRVRLVARSARRLHRGPRGGLRPLRGARRSPRGRAVRRLALRAPRLQGPAVGGRRLAPPGAACAGRAPGVARRTARWCSARSRAATGAASSPQGGRARRRWWRWPAGCAPPTSRPRPCRPRGGSSSTWASRRTGSPCSTRRCCSRWRGGCGRTRPARCTAA